MAAGEGALYSIGRWIVLFAIQPVHEDIRLVYVAAEAGLRYGWSRIYDIATLQALSAHFPAGQNTITSSSTYVHPPLWAWLFVPLTWFPEPVAYASWTLLSLIALMVAWHLTAPYRGLAKITLVLVALALWPVMDAFYRGQPSICILALVAVAWKLCRDNRPLAAGVALAVATALKPQAVVLVPIALVVSGRYRPAIAWAAGSALLAGAAVISLGPAGLTSWWHALNFVQTDTTPWSYSTLAYLFGLGPLTYALLAIQGLAALAIAWRQRANIEVVFAVGLLGSVAFSFHLHVYDYSLLVLSAWLVLRTSPPLWHRLWLLAGVFTMQALPLGIPVPQLIWDAGWLVILGTGVPSGKPLVNPSAQAAGLR